MENKDFYNSVFSAAKDEEPSGTVKGYIEHLKGVHKATSISIDAVNKYGKAILHFTINGNSKRNVLRCPLLKEGDKVSLTAKLCPDKYKEDDFVVF